MAQVEGEPYHGGMEYPPSGFITHEMLAEHRVPSLLPEKMAERVGRADSYQVYEPPPGPEI